MPRERLLAVAAPATSPQYARGVSGSLLQALVAAARPLTFDELVEAAYPPRHPADRRTGTLVALKRLEDVLAQHGWSLVRNVTDDMLPGWDTGGNRRRLRTYELKRID